MIQSIHIQNYKALRDVTLKLTPVHVLIGPNDTGKTSILEAVAALCRSVDHEIRQAFLGRWEGNSLVNHSAKTPQVEFRVSLSKENGDYAYQLSCGFEPNGRNAHVTEEWCSWPGVLTDQHLKNGRNTHSFVCQVFQGHRRGDDAKAEAVNFILKSLRGVWLCRWSPRMLALPVAPRTERRLAMDPSGFGLAMFLDDILGENRERFIALETEFRRVFPEVDAIKLMRSPAYRAPSDDARNDPSFEQTDGKGIYFTFHGRDQNVPASQVSDGLLIVLAYLAVLYSPESPRVILIEEPENGIHPKRLQDVISIIRRLVEMNPLTHVIMTTHSPYVIDFFKPEEVSLCQRDESGDVTVHPLSESKTVRDQIDLFTLGEIWTGEGDDALAGAAPKVEGTAP